MLGIFVYNASEVGGSTAGLSDLDFVAAGLFTAAVAPLSVGLSLANTTYEWFDLPVMALLAVGGSSVLLLVWRDVGPSGKPLLGLRLFGSFHGASTFGGAVFLGALVSVSYPPVASS